MLRKLGHTKCTPATPDPGAIVIAESIKFERSTWDWPWSWVGDDALRLTFFSHRSPYSNEFNLDCKLRWVHLFFYISHANDLKLQKITDTNTSKSLLRKPHSSLREWFVKKMHAEWNQTHGHRLTNARWGLVFGFANLWFSLTQPHTSYTQKKWTTRIMHSLLLHKEHTHPRYAIPRAHLKMINDFNTNRLGSSSSQSQTFFSFGCQALILWSSNRSPHSSSNHAKEYPAPT